MVTASNRPRLPKLIRYWSWGNACCMIAVILVVIVTPVYLPMVLIAVAAGLLQIVIGILVSINYAGIANEWAAWGASRSALLGFGSRSVAVNRIQGVVSVVAGIALLGGAVWLATTFHPLL